MKIWIYLESVKPLRWGVRYGKKYWTGKEIRVFTNLITQSNKKQPYGVLVGYGHVSILPNCAVIHSD